MDKEVAWSSEDPFIHTKKTSFMQRLSDRVRQGATLYIEGQTPLKRVPALAEKLSQRWPLNLTKMQASRRSRAGHGTYYWLGWLEEDSQLVHWFVLHKPGAEIDRTDRWREVLDDRLTLTGYELVRHTRSGASAPAWTWRYTKQRFADLRDLLVADIRGRKDLQAAQLMHTLYRSPGFAGVREQVKKLRQLCLGEWKRSRGKDSMFEIPRNIGYVSRLADKGVTWSLLAKKSNVS
jgi:hypothetical protein